MRRYFTDRLGRQMRDVKEVFSALKENLDQIMANLQDGLLLFTRDWRVVLVSASAEQFVGRPRRDILGCDVEEIFSDSNRLGQLVLQAFRNHQPIGDAEVDNGSGRRVQVALDFIEERGERIGALLTMRDAESVRRIEDEIELSRRLAAIGRLTSGVAHEVKNPINAIVVHLEVLREKLHGHLCRLGLLHQQPSRHARSRWRVVLRRDRAASRAGRPGPPVDAPDHPDVNLAAGLTRQLVHQRALREAGTLDADSELVFVLVTSDSESDGARDGW
jgi:PAS domain S-box-containing protein